MKLTFESTGEFEKTIGWLKSAHQSILSDTAREVGAEGVAALSAATPVGDTGETANGWEYRIENKDGLVDLSFVNNAHQESPVNVAILIETGHGTGTGGYIPPKPYIKQALDSVFESASDKITKGMTE